ncbi:MAG: extracellular catalytic domain type 1 short-chain-length polyhydroxyalkanoate depolymerase [Wenzhouxiangella sp.]
MQQIAKQNTHRLFSQWLTSTLLLWICLWMPAAVAQSISSWQLNQSLGGFNQVHVYTPASLSPVGDGRALMLVLHGCTQSIDAYLTANLELAAENHGMVIAVPDAVNKAGFGCWSYWQGAIARNSGDYARLINLANGLVANPSLQIDADQVYIAGLSSGAAFAAQTACVAPDVFAGVAPSAGPTIGTSSSGAIGPCETVSPAQFESRCRGYAGSAFQGFFDTQIAAVGHGTSDTTVNTCYNSQNANGYARLYGVSPIAGTTTLTEGSGSAEETQWEDGRVARLWFNNLGHVWSGGPGASGGFIGGNSINFADYLGGFFAANNARISRNERPAVDALVAEAIDSTLLIEGQASDPDGEVVLVNLAISLIDSTPVLVDSVDVVPDAEGQFSATRAGLADGLYEVAATAIDDESAESVAVSTQARVGPPPPDQAPSLSDLAVDVDGDCASVSGVVTDVNQNLDSVNVAYRQAGNTLATVPASVSGVFFAATQCGLPGGSLEALVSAIDTTNLSASASISFDIDAGQTGDFNFHIAEGHITWGSGYAACYLAFGTAPFTMRETPAGDGHCRWVADADASCFGPTQSCKQASPPPAPDPEPNPDPNPEPEPDPAPEPPPETSCTAFTAFNYIHRAAGRAYSTGSFWAPSYFSQGGNDPMPGSTYGFNTVYSLDGTSWRLGACPSS